MADCETILAQIEFYQAAITYDQAALTLAQNQLSADQTAYYYWQYQAYMNGCYSMAKLDESKTPQEITEEDLKASQEKVVEAEKDLKLASEEKEKALEKLNSILNKSSKD